ncbi:MAG TPA: DUF72 domain-containing protein [Fimbriimonadaceae bacterium]|jgi:uncharacterized protein YecE (DUF72 family)
MARLYLGLSGYSYKPWQGEGRFYPAELKQKQFLSYYAEHYPAVEMDGTWYRMPSEAGVQGWIEGSPSDFKYTFKAHRSISHIQRLKAECLESVKFQLKRLEPMEKAGKMGALFVQLPPNFKRNDERLKEFVTSLPEGHPYAIEFRNEAWFVPEVEAILRDAGVTWVSWDTEEVAGQRRDTGSFIYSRMRRETYTDDQLKSWADYFQAAMDKGKDCYVFFKHEDEGSPWVDADRLKKIMGL